MLTTRSVKVVFIPHKGEPVEVDYSEDMVLPDVVPEDWFSVRWDDFEIGNSDIDVHDTFSLIFANNHRGYIKLKKGDASIDECKSDEIYVPVLVIFRLDGKIVHVQNYTPNIDYPRCDTKIGYHIQWDSLDDIYYEDIVINGHIVPDSQNYNE